MTFRKQSGVNDENFYSSLAADFDGESDVSDADVVAVSKMLADMDDMDDDLFKTSLKSHMGSSRASSAAAKESSEPSSRPASRLSTANSKEASPRRLTVKKTETLDSDITGEGVDINDSLRKGTLDSPHKTSPSPSPRRQSKPKTQPKKIDFGDFDEDDPLAGLFSDDEDVPPKKTVTSKKKTLPKKPDGKLSPRDAKTESPAENTEDVKGLAFKEDASSTKESTGAVSDRPSTGTTAARKKIAELDFGDDSILDSMGFDEEILRADEKKKAVSDVNEKQAAKDKVNELFRKKTNFKDKLPAGKKKEFVLDKKYIKTDPKSEEPKEEDFIFGDYKPSSVRGLGRPESAPPPRSVRFKDDEDDDTFGASMFAHPRNRGRIKPTVHDTPPKRPHTSADTRQHVDSTNLEDDWLELAISSNAKENEDEKSLVTNKNEAKSDREDLNINGVGNKEKPATSAADYLGLAGDDIDPDTLISKPLAPQGQSSVSTSQPKGQELFTTPVTRDTMSPFPWEGSDMSSSKHRSSAQADRGQSAQLPQMKGDDFDNEEEHLQSSLTPNQFANPRMQDQNAAMATTALLSHGQKQVCGIQYIGETKNALKRRFYGHRSTVNTKKVDTPVGNHFNLPNHALSDMILQGIESLGNRNDVVRLSREKHWMKRLRTIQPHGLNIQEVTSLSTTPSATSRPEPKWRQELRQRQLEQHQQQRISSPAPESAPLPVQPNQSRPRPWGYDSEMGQGGVRAGGMPGTLSDDLMKQMQIKQKELDTVMQKQQEQWLAQHQEQMQRLQESLQQSVQQQLQHQMQQQIMNNSAVQHSSPFSTLPLITSTTMPSIASLSLEAKIQQLEMEKKLVEIQIETIQQQHQQQLAAVEGAHKDYVQLLDESSKRREARLRQESEHLIEQYEGRLEQMNSEQMTVEQTHQQRIQRMNIEHTQQFERIQQGHRKALDILQHQHQEELQQVQRSLKQELENVTNTQSHSRSLQAVVDRVQATSKELDHLQTTMHGQHQTHIDDRLKQLRQKDEQLQGLEKRLSQQQDETQAERARLEGLVHRLEAHIQQQTTQLDEERWRLRQEQNKIASLQRAVEEERKIMVEQMTSQQSTLQQAKDAVLLEQKSIMAQCLEERKSLALERTQIASIRRELEITMQTQADKALQSKAEQEGKLESLVSERSQLTVQSAALKQQQESLEVNKQKLREEQEVVETEKRRLQQLAEVLRKKSKQIEDTIYEALTARNEGELALDRARKTEAVHHNRQRNIIHQLQILRATEKHTAQERLDLAQEQRNVEKMRKSVRCQQCSVSIPVSHHSDSNFNTLPVTSTIPGSSQIHSTPLAPSRGDAKKHVQEVITEVEMYTSIYMWKTAAEKDKDFLEEESAYLETLRSPMPASVRDQ